MKKMNTKLGLALAASLLASVTTHAFAEEKAVGTGPNPYRDCGIGAALFPETDWAAVSSNVIWDVGSTALTSATMSPETCSGQEVVAAEFILNTYDNLIEETAQGEGQHLTTVLDIYGCEASQQPAIINAIRSKAASDVASEDFAGATQLEKANKLFGNIHSTVSSEYSAHCAA